MKRLLALCLMFLIAALLSAPLQAKDSYSGTTYEEDVWIVLYYAAVVDQDPIAEFYLDNPEAEGALEYGDYCYWSYAGSKGGSYKHSSNSNNDRNERSSDSDGDYDNPEEDGATEYGDYGYYSYAGSKGGSYKTTSRGSNTAS